MLRAQKEWDRSLQQEIRQLELQQHEPAARAAGILARGHPPQQGFRKHHHARVCARKTTAGAPIGKDLTEQIVGVQRKMLAEEMNPDRDQGPADCGVSTRKCRIITTKACACRMT